MKPTKRHSDPLGRSPMLHRYSRYALCLAIAITGSVWPIRARSIEAIFDTKTWRELFLPRVSICPPDARPKA